jgi:two-component system, NtrC family, sensor kinase
MFASLFRMSLRRKVLIGAAVVYLFMAGAILAGYYSLHILEQKIRYLEDVGKLEESVLEIRRFEKNYFLYGDKDSLSTAMYHLNRAERILEKNSQKLEALSSPRQTADFRNALTQYSGSLTHCSGFAANDCSAGPGPTRECAGEIRRLGASMADFAEGVAKRKRNSISDAMRSGGRLPLLGLLVAGCGFFAIGSFLFTKVTRSLRLLELGVSRIVQGEFEPLAPLPPERDIRTILIAFNGMAARLRTREEQLVQSKKLAALGAMLAGVAHEVNNPLSNISSSCEILLEELDEGEKEFQRKLLTKVLEQVERARTLILSLLEFSRTKELNPESVNLKKLINGTIDQLGPSKPEGVRIVMEMDEKIHIYVDPRKMEQALTNLISNAVQAMDGQGKVTIRAWAATDGTVKIRISDSGSGIPEEDISKIFDPFYTTKDVGKGTGLGLFITHDIIQRNKGSIQVKSVPGKGTVFTLRVPAAEPSHAQPSENSHCRR